MDYDRTNIPAGYDRGRDHGPEVLELWMNAIAAHLDDSPHTILDVGCGTGRFSDALSVHFDADVVGLDPSLKMLDRAREKPCDGRVFYNLARAEALPLRSQSIDVIFMSMSFHHFSDQRLAAAECHRVLRDGGSVFVRTGSRERITTYPYYPFFPATHPILEEVLPDIDTFRRVFEHSGFHTSAVELIPQTIAPSWDVYADKLATGSDSVLARLDRADFDRGLAAVRHHAMVTGEQPIVEAIDLLVFRR
jgi:ubiquinone/menaquinone biosynthesis C-methylase UbiE